MPNINLIYYLIAGGIFGALALKTGIPAAPLAGALIGASILSISGKVNLAEWPIADKSLVDENLTLVTRLAMRLASLGRSARASAGLKVRQPLAELVVQLRENEDLKHLERACPQLLDELNVKLVRDAREIGGLTDYIVKPNLPRLGGRGSEATHEILDVSDAPLLLFILRLLRGRRAAGGRRPRPARRPPSARRRCCRHRHEASSWRGHPRRCPPPARAPLGTRRPASGCCPDPWDR